MTNENETIPADLKELTMLAGILRTNHLHFAAIVDRKGPNALEIAEEDETDAVIEIELEDVVALVHHLHRAASGLESIVRALGGHVELDDLLLECA
jgi:hypothetical protein